MVQKLALQKQMEQLLKLKVVIQEQEETRLQIKKELTDNKTELNTQYQQLKKKLKITELNDQLKVSSSTIETLKDQLLSEIKV